MEYLEYHHPHDVFGPNVPTGAPPKTSDKTKEGSESSKVTHSQTAKPQQSQPPQSQSQPKIRLRVGKIRQPRNEPPDSDDEAYIDWLADRVDEEMKVDEPASKDVKGKTKLGPQWSTVSTASNPNPPSRPTSAVGPSSSYNTAPSTQSPGSLPFSRLLTKTTRVPSIDTERALRRVQQALTSALPRPPATGGPVEISRPSSRSSSSSRPTFARRQATPGPSRRYLLAPLSRVPTPYPDAREASATPSATTLGESPSASAESSPEVAAKVPGQPDHGKPNPFLASPAPTPSVGGSDSFAATTQTLLERLQNLEQRIDAKDTRFDKLDDSLRHVTGYVKEVAELAEAKKLLEEKEQQLEQNKEELESNRTTIKSLQDRVSELEAELKEVRRDKELLEDRFEDLSRDLDETNEELEEAAAHLEAEEETRGDLEAFHEEVLGLKEETIEHLEAQLEAKAMDCHMLLHDLDDTQLEVDAISEKNRNLKSSLKRNKLAILKKDIEIQRLKWEKKQVIKSEKVATRKARKYAKVAKQGHKRNMEESKRRRDELDKMERFIKNMRSREEKTVRPREENAFRRREEETAVEVDAEPVATDNVSVVDNNGSVNREDDHENGTDSVEPASNVKIDEKEDEHEADEQGLSNPDSEDNNDDQLEDSRFILRLPSPSNTDAGSVVSEDPDAEEEDGSASDCEDDDLCSCCTVHSHDPLDNDDQVSDSESGGSDEAGSDDASCSSAEEESNSASPSANSCSASETDEDEDEEAGTSDTDLVSDAGDGCQCVMCTRFVYDDDEEADAQSVASVNTNGKRPLDDAPGPSRKRRTWLVPRSSIPPLPDSDSEDLYD